MSSFGTHMLIGAVGGLALATLAPLALLPVGVPSVAPALLTGGLAVGSALLATWPDIDEANSWIGRRVRLLVGLLGLVVGAFVVGVAGPMQTVVRSHDPYAAGLAGALLGLLVGLFLIGPLLLLLIRRAAGGHRRLTHSLVLSVVLAVIGVGVRRMGFGAWALLPVALLWGQLLHVVGDVVTPVGVPLLWPLSDRDLRLLPKPLARYGERIVAAVAVIIGWTLLRGAVF